MDWTGSMAYRTKIEQKYHCAWAQIEASVDDDEYGLLLMNNGAACFVHWH